MTVHSACVLVTLVLMASACGLPSDGEPQVIAPDRVPDALAAPPASGADEQPGPTDDTALIYVFDEEGSNLEPVEVTSSDGGAAALEALLAFTPGESQQSFVPPTLTIEGFRLLESGVVVLEVSTGLEEVEGLNQAKAIAQLVATVHDAEPRANGLAIEVDGTRIELPDENVESADIVWIDDYVTFTVLALD